MKKTFWILIALLCIIAGVVAIYFASYEGNNKKQRQAVFLSNGQVYFGYVSNPRSQIVKIQDIYYLKTQDLLQPNAEQTANKKISLVKLGKELHGPTDEMLVNRDQILFIETMREDSKVAQAISKYSEQSEQ